MMSRYEVSRQQDSTQPGSDGEVLRNRLAIVNRRDMDAAELELLHKLYLFVLRDHLPTGPLTVRLIRDWHRRWLGNLYDWAGHERSVNMSKDGFPFAAADRIPDLLRVFERDVLFRHTPCHGMDRQDLIFAVARTHVEFILIHPFREGNGRISRLLADVMASQAGMGPLDYGAWEMNRARYILAIQAGMTGNYTPMCACVAQVLP
ncbi:MAG: cell filamentation protein Fic [Castellaniella sp.]|uniref:Fic/DOC family protein n=1 Tax=Castellaniella sp. TaxID=1955812 RepID=UPI001204E454|nr:Fic family protein [Castellaniella sp.]TAN29503.1 MAG: cell filamentation protein Fic [Castellaniella sp.]